MLELTACATIPNLYFNTSQAIYLKYFKENVDCISVNAFLFYFAFNQYKNVCLLLFIFGVYACMYTTCVCTCVWRTEVSLGHCSSGVIHLVFLRQSLSLAWSSPNKLGWLTSEPWGSAHLCFPRAWITSIPPLCLAFRIVSFRDWTQVLVSARQALHRLYHYSKFTVWCLMEDLVLSVIILTYWLIHF